MVRGSYHEFAAAACVLLCLCSVWIAHAQEGPERGYKSWHLTISGRAGCEGTGDCEWNDADGEPYAVNSNDNGKANPPAKATPWSSDGGWWSGQDPKQDNTMMVEITADSPPPPPPSTSSKTTNNNYPPMASEQSWSSAYGSNQNAWQPAPPPPPASSSPGEDRVESEGGEYWKVQKRRVRVAVKEDVWKKPQSSTVDQQDYSHDYDHVHELSQPPSPPLLPVSTTVSDSQSGKTNIPVRSPSNSQTSVGRLGSRRRRFNQRYPWISSEEQPAENGDGSPRPNPQSPSGGSPTLPKSAPSLPQPPQSVPITPPPHSQNPSVNPSQQNKQPFALAWSDADVSRLISAISGIEPLSEKQTTQPPTTTTQKPTTPNPWMNPRSHKGKRPFALTWSEPTTPKPTPKPTTPKPTPKPTTPKPTTPPPPPTTTLNPWLNPKPRHQKRPFALRWSDSQYYSPTTPTPPTTTTTITTTTTTTTPAPTTEPTTRPAPRLTADPANNFIPGLWTGLNLPQKEVELENGDKIIQIIYIRQSTGDKPEDSARLQRPRDEEARQGNVPQDVLMNSDSSNQAMAPPKDPMTADDGQMQYPQPMARDDSPLLPPQPSHDHKMKNKDHYASAWDDFIQPSGAEQDMDVLESQPSVPDGPTVLPVNPTDMGEPSGQGEPKPEGEPQPSPPQPTPLKNPPAMASPPVDNGDTVDSANLCADLKPTPMCTLAFPSCGGFVCEAQRFCLHMEANLTLLTAPSDKEYFRDAFSCVMEGVRKTHCTTCGSVEDALDVFLMDKDPACNCLLQGMRLCDVLHEPRNQYFLLHVFVPFFSRSSFKADLARTVLKATKYCPNQEAIRVFRMLLMLSQS